MNPANNTNNNQFILGTQNNTTTNNPPNKKVRKFNEIEDKVTELISSKKMKCEIEVDDWSKACSLMDESSDLANYNISFEKEIIFLEEESDNIEIELENKTALKEKNEARSHGLKKVILQLMKITSVEELKNLKANTAEKVWNEILSCPEANPITITLSAEDGSQETLTLPRLIWKLHSPVVETGIADTEEQSLNACEQCSKKSLQMFFECLKNDTGVGFIDLDNLLDLSQLADKYEINWLKKECDQYFQNVRKPYNKILEEINNLTDALFCKLPESVKYSIISIFNNINILKANPVNPKDLDNLDCKEFFIKKTNTLLNEFADLKLFLTGETKILPDGSLRLLACDPEIVKSALSIGSLFYSPQIEVSMNDMDFFQKNEIILNTPVILKIVDGNDLVNLTDFFDKNPKIQKLRIVLDCESTNREYRNALLQLIEQNTSLQSIHLTLNNFMELEWQNNWTRVSSDSDDDTDNNININNDYNNDNSEDSTDIWEMKRLRSFENQIKECLELNRKLRTEKGIPELKITLFQSAIESLDESSEYTDHPANHFQVYTYTRGKGYQDSEWSTQQTNFVSKLDYPRRDR